MALAVMKAAQSPASMHALLCDGRNAQSCTGLEAQKLMCITFQSSLLSSAGITKHMIITFTMMGITRSATQEVWQMHRQEAGSNVSKSTNDNTAFSKNKCILIMPRYAVHGVVSSNCHVT